MKSCGICFYQGCGIKKDLSDLARHQYVPQNNKADLERELHKSMGESCSNFRRSCSKCGERIPSEEEFNKS